MKSNCKCVLVVEDDEAIRDSLRFALETEGYVVFSAPNGKIGLESLANVPRPALVLLDLMMPIMNGWEFIEALKNNSELKDTPVVTITASSRTVPAHNVIRKPIDLDILYSTVGQYFQKEEVTSSI